MEKKKKSIIFITIIALVVGGVKLYNCKSGMFKSSAMVGIVVLMLFMGAGCVSNNITEDSQSAIDPGIAIVWHVQPTLEHESIFMCGLCDAFLVRENRSIAIDPQTGRTGTHNCLHILSSGEIPAPFVYDSQRGLFGHPGSGYMYGRGGGGWTMERMIGMHLLDTFDESVMSDGEQIPIRSLNRSREFIPVERVDSSVRVEFEDDTDREWRLTEDAHSGKFALMYNREFVTDFIFDGVIELHNGLYAVRTGDRWGAIDRTGDTVLPFVFEHFVRIDHSAAFAKYDGAYGVLDLS